MYNWLIHQKVQKYMKVFENGTLTDGWIFIPIPNYVFLCIIGTLINFI